MVNCEVCDQSLQLFPGEKFVANSTKLKVSSVFFLGRLTTWSTEGEILNGQHIISLASDDLLTPAAVAAVLTFVDGLFEGRYHNRRGVYDHSLAIKVGFADLSHILLMTLILPFSTSRT